MRGKGGQQEIVGFALIVVLVTVGLMIFLIYSFTNNKGPNSTDDVLLENLMSSIMHYTTSCSINQDKQTVLDMFNNCYSGQRCGNDPRDSCVVLEGLLIEALTAAHKTESTVSGFSIEFYEDNSGVVDYVPGFSPVYVGNCTNSHYRSFERPMGSLNNTYVLLKAC